MNPFDWPGPAFLLFFAGLSALAVAILIVVRRHAEDGAPPAIDLADPYLLAYLRAGPNEAIRVGVVALLDRELLSANDTQLRWNRLDADRYVRRAIEREILQQFKTEGPIADVFSSPLCKHACDEYARQLEAVGALPGAEVRHARRTRLLTILGAVLVVALIKILIGVARDAPVSFLVIMSCAVAFVAFRAHAPIRTRRGDRLLADVRLLFAGLRNRALSLRGRRGDSDVTMLAAVFGVGSLPPSEFPFVPTLFKRAQNSSQSSTTCGSSCSSSSCGGGGDGGGGGCGGCGG